LVWRGRPQLALLLDTFRLVGSPTSTTSCPASTGPNQSAGVTSSNPQRPQTGMDLTGGER
jgi:hypothetical protein